MTTTIPSTASASSAHARLGSKGQLSEEIVHAEMDLHVMYVHDLADGAGHKLPTALS